jgi:hypothetical protein
MDRGRVGEDRGSKETDGCPLTLTEKCSTKPPSTKPPINRYPCDGEGAIVSCGPVPMHPRLLWCS